MLEFKTYPIQLTPEFHKRIKQTSVGLGIPMKNFIIQAIDEKLTGDFMKKQEVKQEVK